MAIEILLVAVKALLFFSGIYFMMYYIEKSKLDKRCPFCKKKPDNFNFSRLLSGLGKD